MGLQTTSPSQPLGNIGNFVAAFEGGDDQQSRSDCGFPGEKNRQKNAEIEALWGRRWTREKMRAALRRLIFSQALPPHPVAQCRVRALPASSRGKPTGFSGRIELRHIDGDPARHSYHGRRACRSLLVCPDCAAEFGGHLREAVKTATERLLAAGYYCFMLTLTAQHGRKTDLVEMGTKFNKAKRWMAQHRLWRGIKSDLGILGQFSALEVTDDAPEAPEAVQTGFHWHQHLLVFYKPAHEFRGWFTEKTASGFERRIKRLWQKALRRFGLDCDFEHGAKLTLPRKTGIDRLQASGAGFAGADPASAKAAAEYVAKGLTWELTGSAVATKQGRKGQRVTMWEILRRISEGETGLAGRYGQYMRAVKGRSFLRWSQGLKAFCGLPDDEQTLLENVREAGDVVDYSWSDREFRPVVRFVQETAIRRIADEAGEKAGEAVGEAMQALEAASAGVDFNKKAIEQGFDPVTGEIRGFQRAAQAAPGP